MEEDKARRKKKRWEEAEAVVCLASWWLRGAGAGALLYRPSIGFGGGSKPGQKRKKISGCRHLFEVCAGAVLDAEA